MIGTLRQDLKYAVRSLRRAPGFTAAAIVTLGLGIGATSAIFTVVNAALLKEPPYPEPDRLLVLTTPESGSQTGQLFLYLRDQSRIFENIAARRQTNGWNLVAGRFVSYVPGQRVSERYFETVGAPLLMGRGFVAEEARANGTDAVVISESLWRRAYGGRQDVLGESLQLGDVPHTVVGVMPSTFRSFPEAEVWTPLRTSAADNSVNYQVVGRLRPDMTVAQAAAEFDAQRAAIREAFPRTSERRLAATTWRPIGDTVGVSVRRPLLILLGAVGFVLLIACVNVASLQLTRALGRRRELATRAALGGSQWRVGREAMTESVLLASAGALAGIAVALAASRVLLRLVSADAAAQMLSGQSLTVDWRVLAFTLVTALVCSVFFGVVPALTSSRVDLRTALAEGAATTSSRRTAWLRRSFVCAELALAVVLMVGAGLLVRTLSNLTSTDVGFTPDGVLVGRMSLQGAGDSGPQLESILGRGIARMAAIPGVVAVAASNGVPVERPFNVALEPPADSPFTEPRAIDWRYVTPDYFRLFGISRVEGRLFDDRDRAGGDPVAIVNEALARAFFGRLNVIDETIQLVPVFGDAPRRIVGVVGDVKARSGTGWNPGINALAADTAPMMFVPAGQAPSTLLRGTHGAFAMTWSIKTAARGIDLERALQAAVSAAEPRLPFITFESMTAVIDRDLDLSRFVASLLAAFTALAAILAAIGLYGLMAYSGSRRRREVSIRMALGAGAARVMGQFMTEGLVIAASGLVIGIAGATALTGAITTLLFGVTPLDLSTYAAVAVLLLAIAALASLVPALRAARLNPVTALRGE